MLSKFQEANTIKRLQIVLNYVCGVTLSLILISVNPKIMPAHYNPIYLNVLAKKLHGQVVSSNTRNIIPPEDLRPTYIKNIMSK